MSSFEYTTPIPEVRLHSAPESGAQIATWVRSAFDEPGAVRILNFEALCALMEDSFDIDVLVKPFGEDEIDGLTTTIPEWTLVQVNSSKRRTRMFFTLAHEFGHALLHKGEYSQLREHPLNNSSVLSSSSPEEVWCNAFAAALLLPGEALEARPYWPLDACLKLYVSSGLSWEATLYRLKSLDLLPRSSFEEYKSQSALLLAQSPQVGDAIREQVNAVDSTPTNGYRQPKKLTARVVSAYRSGKVSARPVAMLKDLTLEEVHKLRDGI